MWKHNLFCLVIFITASYLISASEIRIEADQCTDTYIDEDDTLDSFGTEAIIVIRPGISLGVSIGLLRFNIFIDEGGPLLRDDVIINATLFLRVESGDNPLTVSTATTFWNGTTTFDSWQGLPGSAPVTPVAYMDDAIAHDVADFINFWKANNNRGWVMYDPSQQAKRGFGGDPQLIIASCDSPMLTDRPYLVVNIEERIAPTTEAPVEPTMQPTTPVPTTLPATTLPPTLPPTLTPTTLTPTLPPSTLSPTTMPPTSMTPTNSPVQTTLSPTDASTDAPTLAPILSAANINCEFYFDDAFLNKNDESLFIYSHVCALCTSDIAGVFQDEPSTVTIDKIPVYSQRVIQIESTSAGFCFLVPRISLSTKRDTVAMEFTLLPFNVTVAQPVEFTEQISPTIGCGQSDCTNVTSVFIPDNMEITSSVNIVNDIVIEGNFTLSETGVVSLDAGTTITVTGCTELAGDINVNVSAVEVNKGEELDIPVILTNCLDVKPTHDLETTGNMPTDGDCTIKSGTGKESSFGLSLLVSRDESNCIASNDEGTSFLAWLIPVVVCAAILILILIIVISVYVTKSRESKYDKEMAKITEQMEAYN